MRSIGMVDLFPEEILVAINGYGYYNLSFTPAQTARFALAMPGLIAQLPRLLPTSQPRWQEARSRYAAVVNYWQTRDLATTSAAGLLGGVRAITAEAAQYY